MAVKRIVTNLAADKPESAAAFYRDILGLELLMDHGWIQTYGNAETTTVQVSIASEGGSGTPVPDLSVEVDNLDEILARIHTAGITLEYGVAEEPWGFCSRSAGEPGEYFAAYVADIIKTITRRWVIRLL